MLHQVAGKWFLGAVQLLGQMPRGFDPGRREVQGPPLDPFDQEFQQAPRGTTAGHDDRGLGHVRQPAPGIAVEKEIRRQLQRRARQAEKLATNGHNHGDSGSAPCRAVFRTTGPAGTRGRHLGSSLRPRGPWRIGCSAAESSSRAPSRRKTTETIADEL